MDLVGNFQRELDYMFEVGRETITIKHITRSRNSEGDITETEDTENVPALVFPLTDSYTKQKFGSLETADCVVILKPSVSVNEKDRVKIDNTEYQVIRIVNASIKGTTIYKELYLEKVE